jgi:hypothetical protein
VKRQTENKIVLVTRQTRWMEMLARHGTPGQAKFYLGSRRLSAKRYQEEDARFNESMKDAMAALSRLGRVQPVSREHLPNFIFGPEDIVVALGQDGLVANTLKYTDGQPVIGVNPDPDRFDGVLLPFKVADLEKVVMEVFAGRRLLKPVTMAEACLNDGRCLRAVNDLFIGPKTHISARYEIRHGDAAEDQSSSGVIVSTGMGSTGWFRSLLAGATGMVESYGYGKARVAQREMPVAKKKPAAATFKKLKAERGRAARSLADAEMGDRLEDRSHYALAVAAAVPPELPKFDGSFPWDARHLCFTVREPFPTRTTGASIVYGRVDERTPLVITSQMPEHGVIFSDGIEADCLVFNTGDVVTVGLSERVGRLVG